MAYIIYQFMYVFYSETKVEKYREILCYVGYFVIITAVHTAIQMPIVVALANVILFFLLTLLYSMDIRKNLLSVVLIYITLACAETLTVLLTSVIHIDILKPYEYDSVFGMIAVRIVCFIAVLLFSSFKNLKSGSLIPKIYWVSLFVVPVGTVVLLFPSLSGEAIPKYLAVVNVVSVLLINVLTFYLYDTILKLAEEKLDQRLRAQQNKYYENQLSLMKEALSNTKMIQHDLKNKLSPIYSLALNGETDQLIESLGELTTFCAIEKEYASSGNSAIDSIINFKLQQVKKDDIQVACDIFIPSELTISSFDIAIILGNLIDNALTGVKTIESDRWIDLKIKYSKGRLIITISNSFDGVILKSKNIILTRKPDKENHGLGLKSIERVIGNYNGAVNTYYTEDHFKIKTLMYV